MNLETIPALSHPDLISGMTLVDTRALSWPGVSFSISEAADAGHVHRSYDLLAEVLGITRDRIATVHQVHGSGIVEIEDRLSIDDLRATQADALVTSWTGVILGVKLADCCGVLLHDPVRHVVAAVHSGWRGTAACIVRHTIEHMVRRHETSPADVQAWLSPCASGRVYEVGPDVQALLPDYCLPLTEKRWLFDNHRAIADQLKASGLLTHNISVDRACTITDLRYHSYRRDKGRSGRMLAFIGMREKP